MKFSLYVPPSHSNIFTRLGGKLIGKNEFIVKENKFIVFNLMALLIEVSLKYSILL